MSRRALNVLAQRLADTVGDCPLGALPESQQETWRLHRGCTKSCDDKIVKCWAKWAEWKAKGGGDE